jgi:divalent metal cation (Fe/Co/Zn/Cd) transporter
MQRILSRLGLTVATCLVGLLIACIGVGFLSAALYLAIQDVASPQIAALSTGAAAFIVAGLLALAVRARRHRRTPTPPGEMLRNTGAQPDLATEIGVLFGAQTTSWVRSHAMSAAALALIAGFVVGASPDLRGALRDMFRRSN